MVSFERELFNFSLVFDREKFSDILVMADQLRPDGSTETRSIKAHQVILYNGSSFFHQILSEKSLSSTPGATIYLRGRKFEHVEMCIQFLYVGYATVSRDEINDFVDLFNELGIQGLKPSQNVPASSGSLHLKEDHNQQVEESKSGHTDDHASLNVSDHTDDNKHVGSHKAVAVVKPMISDYLSREEHEAKVKQFVQTNPETGSPMCGICFKTLSSRCNVTYHVKSVHLPRPDYPCSYCSQVFSISKLRSSHVRRRHAEEKRRRMDEQ